VKIEKEENPLFNSQSRGTVTDGNKITTGNGRGILMKKLLLFSVLFVMVVCFAPGHVFGQSGWTGNVNVFYGLKTINDDWTVTSSDMGYSGEDFILEVSDTSEFGLNADLGKKSWPVTIFFGIYMAEGDDSWSGTDDGLVYADDSFYDATFAVGAKLEVEIREIRIGAKKSFHVNKLPKLSPYIAGGLVQAEAEGKVSYNVAIEATEIDFSDSYNGSNSVDDSAIGFWVGGGVSYQVFRQFTIGAEISFSSAEMDFKGVDIESGGMHYGMFAGYHW
jgi:opacity protein-like surface antigen